MLQRLSQRFFARRALPSSAWRAPSFRIRPIAPSNSLSTSKKTKNPKNAKTSQKKASSPFGAGNPRANPFSTANLGNADPRSMFENMQENAPDLEDLDIDPRLLEDIQSGELGKRMKDSISEDYDPSEFPYNVNVDNLEELLAKNPDIAKQMFKRASGRMEEDEEEEGKEEGEDDDFSSVRPNRDHIEEFRRSYAERMENMMENQFKTGCCGSVEKAFHSGHLSCAKSFMDNSPELKQESILCLAAASDNLTVLKELLRDPLCDLTQCNVNGQTALHFASLYGSVEAAKLLLERGLHIDVKDYSGLSPFFYACKRKDRNIIEFLIDNGADLHEVGVYGETPLHLLAANGLEDLAIKLLEKGVSYASPTKAGHTPFHIAAASNLLQLLQRMTDILERKDLLVFEDENGFTALHIAISENHKEFAYHLISLGVDVLVDTCFLPNPFHYAISLKRLDIVKHMVDNVPGISVNLVNKYGNSGLHYAVDEEDMEMVNFLLQLPQVNVNLQDPIGQTPLMFAVEKSNKEIVSALLAKGGNVSAQNDSGGNSVHLAASEAESDVMEMILKVANGSDINSSSGLGGLTPLQMAIQRNHIGCVRALLNHPDIDINLTYMKNQRTPLHIAVQKELPEVVEMLLKKGANRSLVDSNSQTPLDLAKKQKNINIAKLLI